MMYFRLEEKQRIRTGFNLALLGMCLTVLAFPASLLFHPYLAFIVIPGIGLFFGSCVAITLIVKGKVI